MSTNVMQQLSTIPMVDSKDRKRVSFAQSYWDEARKVICIAGYCLEIGKLSEKARLHHWPQRGLLRILYQECKDWFYESLESTACYYGVFMGCCPNYTMDDAEEFYLKLIDDQAYRDALFGYCVTQSYSDTPSVPRLLMLI